MKDLIRVNGEWIPNAVGDVSFGAEKVKTEYETETGHTAVLIRRVAKLSISGSWQVSDLWAAKFRAWRDADTVAVECYYPDSDRLTSHTCQCEVSESHVEHGREAAEGGLYRMDVTFSEL